MQPNCNYCGRKLNWQEDIKFNVTRAFCATCSAGYVDEINPDYIRLEALAKENAKNWCLKCRMPLSIPILEFRKGLCGLCYQAMNPTCNRCGTRLTPAEVILCTYCRVDDWSSRQSTRALDEPQKPKVLPIRLEGSLPKMVEKEVPIFVIPEKKRGDSTYERLSLYSGYSSVLVVWNVDWNSSSSSTTNDQ